MNVDDNMVRFQKGFSLLEMLLVLAILSILLTISGFLLNSYLQQQRLNEATRTLGETLRRIGELATTESQRYEVTFTENSMTWENEDNVETTQTLPYNVVLTLPMPDLEFSGRGLPQTGQTFTLTLNERVRTVYLAATGAVMYP
ncbi:MAG: pilus assembly FimT family protein [Trueperaceae bacterium]